MAFPQGINFRNTSGFVTDGANEDKEFNLSVPNYPRTSAQGNTVGFETIAGHGEADRVNTNDRRLAGIFYSNVAALKYRIDLPSAGSYDLTVAAGDAGGNNAVFVDVLDTNTSLGPLVTTHTAIGAQNFYDATNTVYSNANWPGSNTVATKTFSSTICRFVIGDGTNLCVIAHVAVAASSGGTSISGTVGTSTWGSPGASVATSTDMQAGVGTSTWSGKAATVATSTDLQASVGVSTWSGLTASVVLSSGATPINATVGISTWAGAAATIVAPGVTASPYRVYNYGRARRIRG